MLRVVRYVGNKIASFLETSFSVCFGGRKIKKLPPDHHESSKISAFVFTPFKNIANFFKSLFAKKKPVEENTQPPLSNKVTASTNSVNMSDFNEALGDLKKPTPAPNLTPSLSDSLEEALKEQDKEEKEKQLRREESIRKLLGEENLNSNNNSDVPRNRKVNLDNCHQLDTQYNVPDDQYNIPDDQYNIPDDLK